MRRLALTIFIALISLALAATPASAGKGWCRSDPIVALNGVPLQFWVAIPEDNLPDVVGAINIHLIVPRGVALELLYVDDGFNGYGEAFSSSVGNQQVANDGTFMVTAQVSIPMRSSQHVRMQVEIVPAEGTSVAVYGQTIGVEVDVTLRGPAIGSTTTRGASVVGASVTAEHGGSAVGGDAVGGSATGADGTRWVSNQPTDTQTSVPVEDVEAATETTADGEEDNQDASAAGAETDDTAQSVAAEVVSADGGDGPTDPAAEPVSTEADVNEATDQLDGSDGSEGAAEEQADSGDADAPFGDGDMDESGEADLAQGAEVDGGAGEVAEDTPATTAHEPESLESTADIEAKANGGTSDQSSPDPIEQEPVEQPAASGADESDPSGSAPVDDENATDPTPTPTLTPSPTPTVVLGGDQSSA